jgi:DNA-binding YbaB/EbfC family protein
MSNFNKMLKQAQRMQQEVEKAQNQLTEMAVPFTSNGVEVIAKGDFTIQSIKISRYLLSTGDLEMLQDIIMVAVNGALNKVREMTEAKLSGITGGLNIPGLF